MHIEDFRDYCLSLKGVEESFPFNETTLVFKVMGKMFALTPLDKDIFTVNLKCDPERAEELRDSYDQIKPGYHMNKKHWNTVVFDDGALNDDFLIDLILHSYQLVVAKLKKSDRELLSSL